MDAVKFLKTAVNRDFYGFPENHYLYKDSGLWQLRDDQDDILHQQGANETFYDFVLRISNIMGWEQKP